MGNRETPAPENGSRRMSRLKVGIVRYASVATRIAQALGVDPPPEINLGARITVTFRSLGATRWPETKQIDLALRIATVTRQVLAEDDRRTIRKRAGERAIVVVFEDAADVRGCAVVAQWSCVVPAQYRGTI